VVVCLRDDAAVHATLDPRALAGRTLVNLTSTAPEQSRRRAEWARDRGIGYLDGTILTPTPTIGQPTALVLYSGPEDVYQAHRPVLASLGGTATYLGDDPGRAAAFDVTLLDIFWTPGERSTIASAAAGLEHVIGTARTHGMDTGVLAASRAVVQRALDGGHGDDGLSRLAAVLAP
jgi:hypothetical protein